MGQSTQMISDVITLNEYKNDGSFLHLYFLDSVDAWVAYGLSAYSLRLFVKAQGCLCLRGVFQKNADAPYFGRGRCHSVAAATSECFAIDFRFGFARSNIGCGG